jgi:hypothetical protein
MTAVAHVYVASIVRVLTEAFKNQMCLFYLTVHTYSYQVTCYMTLG